MHGSGGGGGGGEGSFGSLIRTRPWGDSEMHDFSSGGDKYIVQLQSMRNVIIKSCRG